MAHAISTIFSDIENQIVNAIISQIGFIKKRNIVLKTKMDAQLSMII